MPITKEQILAHADRLSKLSSDLMVAKEQMTKEAVDFNRITSNPYAIIDAVYGTVSDRPTANTNLSGMELLRKFALS